MVARARIAAACLGACLLGAGSVSAQPFPFRQGDVFASVSPGQVWVFRRDEATNTYVPVLALSTGQPTLQTTGSAFDRDGNFYVTTFTEGATNGTVVRFARDFDASTQTPLSLPTGASAPESISFDAQGRMYVGHARLPTDRVVLMTTSGTIVDTFAPATEGYQGDATNPHGTDWVDLASDQKTLFYTSEGRLIKRYDVAARAQLDDFANLSDRDAPSGRLFALRILPDGGVLVADNVNIKRLDAQGTLIQTYDVEYRAHACERNGARAYDQWFAVNLDPDRESFWSGDTCTGEIHRFRISDGFHLDTIDTGWPGTLFGVSIFGELTGGTTPPPPPPPPDPKCEAFTLGVQSAVLNSCSTLTLCARLICDGAPLAGRLVKFTIAGYDFGETLTNEQGFAIMPGIMLPEVPGRYDVTIVADFEGDAEYPPISGSASLTVNPTQAPSDIETAAKKAKSCAKCGGPVQVPPKRQAQKK